MHIHTRKENEDLCFWTRSRPRFPPLRRWILFVPWKKFLSFDYMRIKSKPISFSALPLIHRQSATCPAEGRVGRVPLAYALLRHMVMPSPVFDCVSPGTCEANRPLDLPLMWLSLWTNKTCVPPCREAFLMELNCHFDIGKTACLPMSVAITLEGRHWSWPLWLNVCQGLVLTHTATPVLVDILQ